SRGAAAFDFVFPGRHLFASPTTHRIMLNDSSIPPRRPDSESPSEASPSALPRRDFIKVAGVGAGMMLFGGASAATAAPVPGLRRGPFIRTHAASPDIVVIGAGAWGGWTSLNLRKMGAKVTMIDA